MLLVLPQPHQDVATSQSHHRLEDRAQSATAPRQLMGYLSQTGTSGACILSAHSDVSGTWTVAAATAFDTMLERLGGIKNDALALAARTSVRRLLDAANLYRPSNLPPLSVTEDAYEGALLVEWIFPGRRIGLTFDAHPDDSGWSFVASEALGGAVHSGGMDSFDPYQLIAWVLRKA